MLSRGFTEDVGPEAGLNAGDMFDFSVGVGRPHHFSAPSIRLSPRQAPPPPSNSPWYEMKSTINFYGRAAQLIEK